MKQAAFIKQTGKDLQSMVCGRGQCETPKHAWKKTAPTRFKRAGLDPLEPSTEQITLYSHSLLSVKYNGCLAPLAIRQMQQWRLHGVLVLCPRGHAPASISATQLPAIAAHAPAAIAQGPALAAGSGSSSGCFRFRSCCICGRGLLQHSPVLWYIAAPRYDMWSASEVHRPR